MPALPLATPDITNAQIVSVVGALTTIMGVILAAPERLQIPLIAAIALIAAVWIIADVYLRGKRATAVATIQAAAPPSVTGEVPA